MMQLFDAAIVANRAHAPSWHGWGLLEKRQGNFMKAKDLWMKVRAARYVFRPCIWRPCPLRSFPTLASACRRGECGVLPCHVSSGPCSSFRDGHGTPWAHALLGV